MRHNSLVWTLAGLLAVGTLAPTSWADESAAKDVKKADAPKKPQVEVVFVIDTTGSMGGLIAKAKSKIWAIANTLATAEPSPEIKMGLVAFRDRKDQYVTQVTDLSDDLDAVYKSLMGFQAAGGGDGPESVNQALHEAITKISWSKDDDTYRVIFLVGDAEPHMDYKNDVQYQESCKLAAKKAIWVNTIQCGNNNSATVHFEKIASLAEGSFARLDQSGGVVTPKTPFDEKLAKLSTELNGTVVLLGSAANRKDAMKKLQADEKALAKAPTDARARRAEFKGSSDGAAAPKADGVDDAVQQLAQGQLKVEELKEADLPEPLQKMTKEERKKYIDDKAKERKEIQKKINELSQKRQSFIRSEMDKQIKEGKNSLDNAVYQAIKKQAAKKGLKYNKGPKH